MPTNIIPLLVGKVLECGYMPREVKTEKPKYKGVKDKIDTGLEIIRRTDFPMPDKNGQFKPRGKKIAILKWD